MKSLVKKTIVALAACAALAGPAAAGMLDDIIERGKVRIGVSLGGEPIGFRDDKIEQLRDEAASTSYDASVDLPARDEGDAEDPHGKRRGK